MFIKFWNFIKSLFKTKPLFKTKKTEEIKELKNNEETIEVKNNTELKQDIQKIAIVVGHTQKSQGATNYKGETEYSFNSRIADKICEKINTKSNKKASMFFRDYIGRSGVASEVGNWGADLSLELHFNSFKKKAYGCEVLISNQSKYFNKCLLIADELTDLLAKKFNLKERRSIKDVNGILRDGVKVLEKGDRGLYNLTMMSECGVKYSLLIEPCFANIETEESFAIFENEDEYANVLANYLCDL